MAFQWPLALLSLAVPALLFAAYWLNLRRRRKNAVRYSNVALLRSVVPRRSKWRRHAPIALLLTGVGVLAVAAARPQATRSVPYARTSIILALDVSRSMCSNDVSPNRLTVAQAAAKSFVEQQPGGSRMGLVVFSGFAQLAVAPTTDRKALVAAIDGLTTGFGTAIGAAMLKGIDAIAEINPQVAPVGEVKPGQPTTEAIARAGDFVPDVVVLLTDGANTRGVPPLDAVPYAVERKVRVYTIGFGSTSPGSMVCTAAQLGSASLGGPGGGFGGGGGGGGGGGPGRFLRADEPTLQEVAKRTGGEYYKAQDAAQLREVFAELPKDVAQQNERREVTTWFAAAGALLALAAIVTSLRWSPYP